MTERAPDTILRHSLQRQHRRHQRALLLRHSLRGAAACAGAITLAVLAGVVFSSGVFGAWTRLLALVAALALVLAAVAWRFARERLALDAYLERVEARFPALRSLVRNAVDFERAEPGHVSGELAHAVRRDAATRLHGAGLDELNPPIRPRRPALVMAAGLAVLVAVALAWPARTGRSWTTLWNPPAAAAPVRLVVEPGSVTVTPGAALAVRARVWGSEGAPRLHRDQPGSPEAISEGREQGGRVWRFELAQLTRAQEYWVKVAGATSPRYRIALAGSLSPVSFEIEYRSPSYARLPNQHGTAARGELTALRGTEASLIVTFDRDLERLDVTTPDRRTTRWTSITPRRWRGVVPVDRDGEYELLASARPDAETKDRAREGRFRYRITALTDAPPVLVVQVPEGDMDLPAGQQIPLDILAQDDLGLTELLLQVRKDPERPWTALPVARFGARPREARVASRWDASTLGLLPGETASFRFVLFDDNAVTGRGQAISPTFELRFPSLAELYDRVDEKQAGAQHSLERVAEKARELQKTLDKLSRQPPRQEAAPNPGFERSEELRSALQRQQEMGRQIDEAAEQLRQSIEQAAERQAFDQELMAKLRQVNQLMEQIQSREFREAMRKMQEALENLDRRAMERQMPEWRAENRELLANLERTVELLKKLREEERLQSLAQRAQELKAQQDALNREHQESKQQPDQEQASGRGERQEQAAQQTEALAKETQEAGEQSDDAKRGDELKEASKQLSSEAAPAQRQASEQASQQQGAQAAQSGAQASQSLEEAAERLQSLASEMQEQQSQLDLAAVRRAAQDLVSLQRASEGNLSSSLPPDLKADRQTDLSEGTARVADSLYQLSRQTPFISPQLAEALGRAIGNLGTSGRELAGGNRARGEESGRMAGRSLNQAVLELRSTEAAMCKNPGQGQGGRMNPQRIGGLQQQQSLLNQESRSLAKRLSEQMRLSSGDRSQLDRLAQEQERIRRELEEIRRDEASRRELLGRLDQTEREMKEVEEGLRQGALDSDLEQKQQRILSRLLDAERSVNRRDFDPTREARPGEDIARQSPAELPADVLRQGDRFRHDLLKSELDRYPAQYRAFVEAYLRLLNGSPR